MRCARSWRRYPGLQTEVVTFLGDRISESLTGETADIAVKVFGDDLDALDHSAHAASTPRLRGTPGIADLQFKPQSGTPTLGAAARSRRAGRQRAQDAAMCWTRCRPIIAGAEVGQTYAGIRSVDVTMLLPEVAAQPARTSVRR